MCRIGISYDADRPVIRYCISYYFCMAAVAAEIDAGPVISDNVIANDRDYIGSIGGYLVGIIHVNAVPALGYYAILNSGVGG
jgi:hypothetical protein